MPSLTDVITGKTEHQPQDPTPIDARGQKVISSLRQEYPDLNDVSDDDLVGAVLDVEYPDLPEEDAIQALRDVYAGDIPETPEPPKRTVGSVLKDVGKAIWEDVTALPKAAYHYGQAQRMLEAAEADPQFRGAHEALAKLEDVKRESIRGGIFGASMLASSLGPEAGVGVRSALWTMARQGAAGGAVYNALTAAAEGRSKDIVPEALQGAALGGVVGAGLGGVGAGVGRVLRRGRVPVPPEAAALDVAAPPASAPPSTRVSPRVPPSAASEADALAFANQPVPGPTGLPESGFPGRSQWTTEQEMQAALLPDRMRAVHPENPTPRRPFPARVTGPGADTTPRPANPVEQFVDGDIQAGQGNIYDDVAAGTMTPEQGTAAILENMGMLEDASEDSMEKIYTSLVSHRNAAQAEMTRTFPPMVQIAQEDLLPAVTAETQKLAEQMPVGRPVFMQGKPMQVSGYTPSGKLQVTNQAGQNFEAYVSDLSTQPSGFMSWLEKMERDARARMRERGALFSNPIDQLGDMAIVEAVGAARLFRVGARNFAQWADDMLREFGDAIKPHLDQVWQRSQKFLQTRVHRLDQDLVDTKSLMEAFNQGKPGATWYDDSFREVQSLLGDDTDMFMRMVAATSAGRSTESNLALALRAYGNWKMGGDIAQGQIRSHRMMLLKAVRGEDFGNLKVQNFYKALMGDPNAVVIDRWMARVMGFKKDALTPAQYRFAQEIVKDLAKDAQVTPRQFQAALWAAAKGERALELAKSGHQGKAGSFRPVEQILREKLGGRSIGEAADALIPKAEATMEAHIKNAAKGVQSTLENGGHTFNANTMNPFNGSGYLTTVYHRVVPKADLTPSEVISFRNEVVDLMDKYSNQGQFTIGTYTMGDNVSLDLNMVLPSKDTALKVGQAMDQFAIGEMKRGQYKGDIPTGKPEGEPQRTLSLDEAEQAIQSVLGGE